MNGFVGGKEESERSDFGKFREIVTIAVHLLVRDGHKSTDIIFVFQKTFQSVYFSFV